MTNIESPETKAVAFLLCDRIRRDVQLDRTDLIGVCSTLYISGMPGSLPPLWAYAYVVGKEGETASAEIRWGRGKQTLGAIAQGQITFGKHGGCEIRHSLGPLPVLTKGVYIFRLLIDGRFMSERSIEVIEGGPPNVDQG